MYKIGVLPGSGLGREIVDEGLKILRVCGERHRCANETIDDPGAADHTPEVGEVLPAAALRPRWGLDGAARGHGGRGVARGMGPEMPGR